MDWQVQFIVAFMSIACAAKTAWATTAVRPSTSFAESVAGVTQRATEAKFSPYANRDGVFKKADVTDRRSYSATLSAALNGLSKYTGLQHISTSYNPTVTPAADTRDNSLDAKSVDAKQQIPIYEEQSENDYGEAGASSAPAWTPAQTEYSREHNQQSVNNALNTAIYNLHEAGAHNNYKTDGTATSNNFNMWTMPTSNNDWQQPQFFESNNKNSVGNFLHHYEHNSEYHTPSYTNGQSEYAHQTQQDEYFQPESEFYQQYETADSNMPDHKQQYEELTNYLSKPNEYETNAHSQYAQQEQSPDVINYVPYPVVKKLHVPVRQPIRIPVSHTIIMPVSKPVPIHIPITQQVQVPVEKDLKIPVERVVPFPVEKHVPVPVEKRVPYPVVRYVPVKVPRPYPIKVPVYKTVLHKMKSLW